MNTSDLEAALMFHLRRAKITGWSREQVFAPPRKWRADFLWADEKVIVECQGGLWNNGKHSRMSGYSNDSRKMAEAQLRGYTVLFITPEMIANDEAIPLIKRALEKREASL